MASTVSGESEKDSKAFLVEAAKAFGGTVDESAISMIIGAGRALEQRGEIPLAIKYYQALSPVVAKSDNERIALIGKKLAGTLL